MPVSQDYFYDGYTSTALNDHSILKLRISCFKKKKSQELFYDIFVN
jgi:hypothetical protein